MTPLYRFISLAVVAAMLAGCSSNPLQITRSICPAAAVARNVSDLTQFSPPTSRDADAITLTATFSDMAVKCSEKGSRIFSDLSVTIAGQRASAAGDQTISVPYFVAVVKGGQTLLSKQLYSANLDFKAGQVRAHTTQTVRADISRSAAIDALGPAPKASKDASDPFVETVQKASPFEMVIGFQLTDDQIIYNARK